MRLALLAVLATSAWAADDVSRQRFSWLSFDEASAVRTLVEGQRFEVAIDYELKDGPPAVLTLTGHGPWIDLPDGSHEKERRHVDYPGMTAQAQVQPGRGRQVFTFTVPKLHGRDSLLWIARFTETNGKKWPWEMRGGCGELVQADPLLRIAGTAPGNLFTYAEPLRFALACGGNLKAGGATTVAWKVLDRDGATAAEGSTALTVPAAPATATLDLAFDRRGVFGLEVRLPDGTSANTTFARIPDVMAITRGEPTRFGLHHVLNAATDERLDATMRSARRLGLTYNRQFVSWKSLQPAPTEWRLENLDRALTKATEHGVAAMICLVNPPPWAMTRRLNTKFEPFAFDEAAWSGTVTTLATRFKGRVAAWEWLNEIVPGDEPDPIAVYLQMVKLGNAAAKAVDPQVQSVLAGGLWPRSFRTGLLAAGIAAHIDVLPIHYGSAAGVAEARSDLDAVSAKRVEVWDDETAQGVSTWKMPLAGTLRRQEQRVWAMRQFPGQLQAGATRILWFGGSGDPAGNWDWRWSDGAPRPVAATMAVMSAKLHRAEPQGSFTLDGVDAFQLFAVGGAAVLVAPSSAAVRHLRTGSAAVTITDDQGEERRIDSAQGEVDLPASPLPFYVEGADLDVLRAYAAPQLLVSQASLLAGRDDRLRVRISNRSAKRLAGTLVSTLPSGWPAAPVAFAVDPGSAQTIEIPISVPTTATPGEHRLAVHCRYDDAALPQIALPWQLAVIDAKALGNLLVDGDLEAESHKAWSTDKTTQVVPLGEFPQGLGRQSLRMPPGGGWQRASQGVELTPGRSYLYSAWVRVDGKSAGSNIDQGLAGGASKALYMPHVFSAANSPDWQYLSMVYRAPDSLVKAGFSPVAKGDGTARFDNVRLTSFAGSNYAAEATRTTTPPVIDGELGEWEGGCPIPLLGPGQTTVYDPAWKPGAANLRGVVKLRWDAQNLYLAAWIDDDQLAAPQTGERGNESDSLVLALHPSNRVAGEDAKAFCYLISPASPGGGSGTSTLYRPAGRSGGLSSGQLAKDSSLHELRIRREGGMTLYEARFPWSELGCAGRLGAQLGCALQLNDNDGTGRAASIAWGDGIAPAWNPTAFGSLILTD